MGKDQKQDHNYIRRDSCMICSECGAAKHVIKMAGYKYWFAGIGYKDEPTCKPDHYK